MWTGFGLVRRFALMGAVLLAVVPPAGANDSSSELAAGGLVLTKTDAIAMQREDLVLSPKQVRVRYEMRNDTGAPVTLRVAFPMPDMPVEMPAEGLSVLGKDGAPVAWNLDMTKVTEPNFLRFQLTVNGRPQAVETDIRADLPDGRNIVDQLYRIGGWRLVLQPSWYHLAPAATDASADDIGPTMDRALRELGAVDGDNGDGLPRWTTRVTLHWMQTFPPGVTVVEHSYSPVLGSQLTELIDGTSGEPVLRGSADRDLAGAFCIDGATARAIRAVHPGHADGGAYSLAYILRTARNWHGPIGTFHLTVQGGPISLRTGETVAVVSLCTDLALRQTGTMRFEATQRDYVPAQDLRVLFVPR